MPRVSVIIPTYNRRDYVQEAIDSVLAQTYTDYEIIVVDDGSTDGTAEALQARYGDRIRYVWQENQGESVARNRGIEMARGEYIAFLDSDDLYLPRKLETQVPILREEPDVGMIYGAARLIDEGAHRVAQGVQGVRRPPTSVHRNELYFRNYIGGPSTTLIRKAVLDAAGGFDPPIRFGEEWDLWLRIVRESRVMAVEETVACIRCHRNAQSHYPNPRHNAPRLADSVRILKQAFARDGVPAEVRRTALARRYSEAFIWAEAVGDSQRASTHLRTAAKLDPRFVTNPAGLGQMIADHFSRVAASGKTTDMDAVLQGLDSALERWRGVNPSDSSFEPAVSAKTYAALSFIASRRNRFAQARRYAALAIRCDWRWVSNRGLVKNLVRGALPQFLQDR